MGAGSADPKLLRVGGHVVMSGGRNCNEINKTVDGVKRGADLMLWLNGDGMAKSWTVYSLSYWHNKLWMNPSMIDWHNCTRRGPNCFSSGVNTSCRTETSACKPSSLMLPSWARQRHIYALARTLIDCQLTPTAVLRGCGREPGAVAATLTRVMACAVCALGI